MITEKNENIRKGTNKSNVISSTRSGAFFLSQYLPFYWLRPENAILVSHQARALNHYPAHSNMLDYCCGDGLFTFTSLGGSMPEDFDVYSGLQSVNLEKHADIFDQSVELASFKSLNPARNKVAVGTDLKSNLLSKARKLDLYEKLIQHDASESFPFTDNQFDQIRFILTINHLENTDQILSALYKTLKPGGQLFVSLYLPSFIEQYAHLEKSYPDNWMKIVERGMRELWPTMQTESEWDSKFKEVGFSVENKHVIFDAKFSLLWNVGMRPLAPILIPAMSELGRLNPNHFKQVRIEFIKLFQTLCEPFMEPFLEKTQPGALLYVLKK